MEQEDEEPADQTETTLTTLRETEPGEADREQEGTTGETVTETVLVM